MIYNPSERFSFLCNEFLCTFFWYTHVYISIFLAVSWLIALTGPLVALFYLFCHCLIRFYTFCSIDNFHIFTYFVDF